MRVLRLRRRLGRRDHGALHTIYAFVHTIIVVCVYKLRLRRHRIISIYMLVSYSAGVDTPTL